MLQTCRSIERDRERGRNNFAQAIWDLSFPKSLIWSKTLVDITPRPRGDISPAVPTPIVYVPMRRNLFPSRRVLRWSHLWSMIVSYDTCYSYGRESRCPLAAGVTAYASFPVFCGVQSTEQNKMQATGSNRSPPILVP